MKPIPALALSLATLALSIAPSNAATADRVNPCDGVSFYQNAKRQCIDLTAISWLGRAEARQADLRKEAKPFRYTIGAIERIEGTRYRYRVSITITNVSTNTVLKTGLLTVTESSGIALAIAGTRAQSLAPGESETFNATFYSEAPIGSIKPDSFQVNYKPGKSRNYDGIRDLFIDRNSAWARAFPYSLGGELSFCLAERCPGGMYRADRP
jgi:hypothetical protein